MTSSRDAIAMEMKQVALKTDRQPQICQDSEMVIVGDCIAGESIAGHISRLCEPRPGYERSDLK